MIEQLYIIILGLFLLGALLMAIINARNPRVDAKKNWIKYLVYLIIVNGLITSILFKKEIFQLICYLIILVGYFEILRAGIKSKKSRVALPAVIVFSFLSFTFIQFSNHSKELLLMTVFVITIFDAFSQLSGQLFGKIKIVPSISPNKTLEGLMGGLLFAILASIYIRSALQFSWIEAALIGLGIALFGLIGDLLASYFKRQFGIKDFSNLLPGHGGFLDRFDSLIFASLFIYILKSFGQL
jgi:phosphatidate cytidylyltransferase